MKKIVLLICLIFGITVLNASEPSVLSAGDLDSGNPYGLTEDEKRILQNKKEIAALRREIAFLKNEISLLKESVEGLRSVISSYSDSIGELKAKLASMDVNASGKSEVSKEDIDKRFKVLEENDKKLEAAIKELALVVASSSSSKRGSSSKNKKLTSAELYKKALKNFRQHKYADAEALFLELLNKKYKPARVNFYLGEANYYQRKYKDAIVFYKKSIELYDKASYIPTLLLHTGISFKKIGDTENAEKIFNALIANYPKSKEAKIAKKYL